jgi:transcriptional regulator with XRE-family HTH domain
MVSNKSAVGAYLRRLREEKGLSTTQTGAILETSEGQIRNIEKGRKDTRGSMLVAFCYLVDGSLDDIAALMLSEQATPEYAVRLAEHWIAQRGSQPGKRAAEEAVEYSLNGH